MEWVEISARTVEEAKDRALDRLGVDERDAEFEILEEPRTGIFGRTKGEARVRARVVPTAPRQKAERRDRRRDRPEKESRAPRTGNAGTKSVKKVTESEVVSSAAAPEGLASEEAVADVPRRSSGTSRGETRLRDTSDLPDLDLAEQAGIVAEVVQGVLSALQNSATVATTAVDDDTMEVSVQGSDLGFLIGPRGRTLSALNEVTRSIVLRRGNTPPSARVHVDVAGYRQRRRSALAAFSTATAEKVRETGLPHALEPMGSADRKVVHDTISDLAGVGSMSVGEDHDRRVVIIPA